MNYEELVKALLSASTVSTAWGRLMQDAAAAIEELQAEVKRLEPKRGERTINPYESTWAIENGYI